MSDFYQHEGTTYEVDSNMLDKFLADKPGATKINFQDTLPIPRASSSEDTSFELTTEQLETKKKIKGFLNDISQFFFDKDAVEIIGPDSEVVKKVDKLDNAFENLVPTFKNIKESALALGMSYIDFMTSGQGSDFILGKTGPTGYLDPETDEIVTFKENEDRWKELRDARSKMTIQDADLKIPILNKDTKEKVGSATDEYIVDQFKKLD